MNLVFLISILLISFLEAAFQPQPQMMVPMQQYSQQPQPVARPKEFTDNEFSDDDDDTEVEDNFTDNDLISLKDQEPDRYYKYKYKRKYMRKLEKILRGMIGYNKIRKKLLKKNWKDRLERKLARREKNIRYAFEDKSEDIQAQRGESQRPIYITVKPESLERHRKS
jgi:hypothetical protein